MITVLHPATLAEWCFLSEFLYWLALRRFPLAIYDLDGGDFRFSREGELYASSAIESPVSYAECEFAGLPPNPRYRALLEDGIATDAKSLEEMEQYIEALSGTDREDLIARRQNALDQVKEIEEWDGEFTRYLDYFKSKLFIDLREGKIVAYGIELKATSDAEIDELVEKNELRVEEMNISAISQKQ